LAGALVGALAQERHHGLAVGNRIPGELVTEVVESEFEARREFRGVGDGFREIGKETRHFFRRFEVALGVARQKPAGSVENFVMAETGEYVENLARSGPGVAHTVGGEERKIERAGNFDGGLVAGFFCTIEVALQFDINVFAAKNAGETFNGSAGFVCSAVSESV